MSLNWTFLSKHSPKLKIHEWIQLLGAYDFLKKLAINSTNCQKTDTKHEDYSMFNDPEDYFVHTTSHNKKSLKKEVFTGENFDYDDMFNVHKISRMLEQNNAETKEKTKNYQAKCYHHELKNKKMIITINPGQGDPKIHMTVHNIVIDMFLIERKMSEAERKTAKTSWSGFTEMKMPSDCTETPTFGFDNHIYGENIIADLLQKDKVKFDAYIYYMKNIVKDPDFQIDFRDKSPSDIQELKKKMVFGNFNNQTKDTKQEAIQRDIDGDVDMIDINDNNSPQGYPEVSTYVGYKEYEDSSNQETPDDHWNMIDKDFIPSEKEQSKFYDVTSSKNEYGEKNMETMHNNVPEMDNSLLLKDISSFCINLQTLGVFTSVIGSQFNQRKFSSVSMRSTLFPVTVGIFPYGSISSTGSTHEIISMLAFMHILIMLWEMYGPLAFMSPVIVLKNLVCSGFIGYSVSKTYLLRVYKDYFERIDEFSGIMYRDKANPKDDKSTILIFAPQGKVCFSGGKNIESVKYHLENAVKMLRMAKDSQEMQKTSDIINYSWPRSSDQLNTKYEKNLGNVLDIDTEDY